METGPHIVCPRCGAENSAGSKSCQRCGGLLHGRTCPHCGRRATRAGARYCEHCGQDLHAAPSGPTPMQQEGSPLLEVATPAPSSDPESLTSPLDAPLSPTSESTPQMAAAIEVAAIEVAAIEVPAPQPQERAAEEPHRAPPAQQTVEEPPRATEQAVASEQLERTAPPAHHERPRRRVGPLIASGAIVVVIATAIVSGLAIRHPNTKPLPQREAGNRTQRARPSLPEARPPETPRQPASASGGTLKITTSPAGARVELDGVPVGATALTLPDVKPGKHTVKISRAGFRSVSRDLEIRAGETLILELTLSPSSLPSILGRKAPATPPLPPPPLPPPPPSP